MVSNKCFMLRINTEETALPHLVEWLKHWKHFELCYTTHMKWSYIKTQEYSSMYRWLYIAFTYNIKNSQTLTDVVLFEKRYWSPMCTCACTYVYSLCIYMVEYMHILYVGLAWYKKRFVSCFKYSKNMFPWLQTSFQVLLPDTLLCVVINTILLCLLNYVRVSWQ